MVIDGYNLDEYVELPLFDLLEVATDEQDFNKRKALFDLANHILENTFMDAVAKNEKSGWM